MATVGGVDVPSKSQAKKAGDRLKKFVRDDGDLSAIDDAHPLREEVEIVQRWRGQFTAALQGVSMGARSMSNTCGVDAQVTQRHKRVERIVQKLARPSSTTLPKMQDIAGARVVLPDIASLRKLQRHIEAKWSVDVPNAHGAIRSVTDYITNPKASGYRAVHIIVEYNDCTVELQLRTQNQAFWADLSESVGRDVGVELKAGVGPDAIVRFFVDLGDRIGQVDDGDLDPWTLVVDLREWDGQLLTVQYAPAGPERADGDAER